MWIGSSLWAVQGSAVWLLLNPRTYVVHSETDETIGGCWSDNVDIDSFKPCVSHRLGTRSLDMPVGFTLPTTPYH